MHANPCDTLPTTRHVTDCAQLLMALNHPNIVRCVECFTFNNKLCIVMDYCSEGELVLVQHMPQSLFLWQTPVRMINP